LSRQGRERYVHIYAWLNDKNRFKKISDFLATQNCKFSLSLSLSILNSFYNSSFIILVNTKQQSAFR
jgi:hypothetical protein